MFVSGIVVKYAVAEMTKKNVDFYEMIKIPCKTFVFFMARLSWEPPNDSTSAIMECVSLITSSGSADGV